MWNAVAAMAYSAGIPFISAAGIDFPGRDACTFMPNHSPHVFTVGASRMVDDFPDWKYGSALRLLVRTLGLRFCREVGDCPWAVHLTASPHNGGGGKTCAARMIPSSPMLC